MKHFTSLFFWVVVVIIAGTTNFVVKHTVQKLDDELNDDRRKTVAAQKQIHDLTAEWTYLSQPELLADLNRRFIGLVPVSPKQIQRNVDSIPLRPAAAPEPVVAAMPGPATGAPVEPQTVATAGSLAGAAGAPTTVSTAGPTAGSAPVPIDPPVSAAPRAAEPSPIVQVSATRMAAAPAPARPGRPASLDALFAQVAGSR